MPEIQLQRVCKKFGGDVAALHDIDLTIHSGELLTIVGPSGSGKSTLLRLIAGLDTPTSGRILFDGIDVTRRSPAERDLSMVFQGENLFPHLDVRDNLAFGLRMRRKSSGTLETRLRTTIDQMQLDDLLDRWPEQLSGGEGQKVALGRVLANQASVNLLDEPLVHVDPSQRAEIHSAIRALHRSTGSTLIHVTHDQREAMSLGERIAVIRDGRLQQLDVPRQVYESPANVFVASFIGDPPMNLFDSQVADRQLIGFGEPPFYVDWADGPIVVGIRPENLRIGAEGDIRMHGDICAVENLGAEQIIELQMLDARCFMRLVAADVSVGQSVPVTCDRVDLSFFVADQDGRRL